MRVRWTRRALRSLDQIAAYIAQDRPMAASRISQRIHEAVENLAANPESGRPGRVPGTRELIIAGTPFIVPYRVGTDALEILTVLHAARKWPESF
ncbi:MAG TPA: type II toxin-antitoxin system RelE/ParE family toxin [Thermoanaerobaculia bacterium]|nr:type II toxin-antitoxin system RelE/ParE family toxin [Thermoanaerobaculia bacterium]